MSKKYRCTPVDSKDLEDVIMLELKKEVKKLIKEETEKKEVVKKETKSKAEYMKEYRKKKKEELGTETKKRGRPTRTDVTDKKEKEKMKKEKKDKDEVDEEDKEEEDQVEINLLKPPKSGYFNDKYLSNRISEVGGLLNRLQRKYDSIKDNYEMEKETEDVLNLIKKMKVVRLKIAYILKQVLDGEKVKYDYDLMKMSDTEKEVKKYFGEETKKDKERIKRDEKQILGEIKKKK